MAQNVVLICLDTVRYDYFSERGGALQAVTDHSFEECRTASTWSVPSHASMFTGELPSEHGFHSATPDFETLDRQNTFLGSLEDFRCVGLSANPYASPIFGFDSLFDGFHHVESSMPFPDGLSPSRFWPESSADGWRKYAEFLKTCIGHDCPVQSFANGVASQVEKLLRRFPVAKPFDDGCRQLLDMAQREIEQTDQPTFAFVNIMDAHGSLTYTRGYNPESVPKEHRYASPDIDALSMTMDDTFDESESDIEAYRTLYAAAVEYTTRQVADFCERVDDDTAVVVTADQGEQLDDGSKPRRFGHVTPDMSEALLHVPLEVVNADLECEGEEFVSHLDLGALVTSLARGTEFEPQSPVLSEVSGLGVAHKPTDHTDFEYWNRTVRCAYDEDAGEKYVWDSEGQASHYQRENAVYSCVQDGDYGILPDGVTELFPTPIGKVGSSDRTGKVDSSVESQLEKLGYM